MLPGWLRNTTRQGILATPDSTYEWRRKGEHVTHEIELARVDKDITPLLVDIVQYNKETGWGKLRTKISNHPLSFSVPSDRKSSMQKQLLDAMDANETYIQTYIVRDKANEPIRFIIVGILELPDEL